MNIEQICIYISETTKEKISMTDDRIINFMQEYDDDHDGQLTVENFLDFYKKSSI